MPRFMWQVIMANHLCVEQIGLIYILQQLPGQLYISEQQKSKLTENRMEKKSANFLILKMYNISVAILKSDLFLV